MNEFRNEVKQLAEKSVKILSGYFDGGPADNHKVTSALRALGFGVKIEHMNQIKEQGDKSLALRVMSFLPKDGPIRQKYLELTHPEVKPLLPRPKK